MSRLLDSTNRSPLDFFHFAAVFLGCILTATGIIVTSPGFAIFGALVLVLGLACFLVQVGEA